MEITLEEAIRQLEHYTIPCGKYKAAYDMAIETMRKYQKIEQIYEEWNKPNHFSYNNAMQAIGEVLDGNDL